MAFSPMGVGDVSSMDSPRIGLSHTELLDVSAPHLGPQGLKEGQINLVSSRCPLHPAHGHDGGHKGG